MHNHVNDFQQSVNNAAHDKRSERIVRLMLEEVAKDCPMNILVQLGQCLIDCRRAELREEAEQN